MTKTSLPWFASIVEYFHLREIDAIIVQFKPAFVDRPEIWMQYHVAVVRYNEGITVHTEFIWQRKFTDVVDWHVRTSNPEQCVIRRICHVVVIDIMIEYRCAHRSQQSIFLPSGSIQGRWVLFNVLVLVQLHRANTRMKNSFDNISFPLQYSLRGANTSLSWNKSEGLRYLIHSRSLQCRGVQSVSQNQGCNRSLANIIQTYIFYRV